MPAAAGQGRIRRPLHGLFGDSTLRLRRDLLIVELGVAPGAQSPTHTPPSETLLHIAQHVLEETHAESHVLDAHPLVVAVHRLLEAGPLELDPTSPGGAE